MKYCEANPKTKRKTGRKLPKPRIDFKNSEWKWDENKKEFILIIKPKEKKEKTENPDGGKIQSIHFEKTGKEAWTKAEAVAWLKQHDMKYSKVDEGPNWFNFRQEEPTFKRHVRQKNKDIDAPLFAEWKGIDVTWGYNK